MLAMILTDEKTPLAIDLREGRELEQRIGVSSKGKIWKNICDALIAFYTHSPNSVNRLIVSTEQLEFLKILLAKPSIESCRGL
jgi:hypothetical protein